MSLNPETQHVVQRLLGRCMLRIQQYERLLKVMLAHHELAGPVDTLEVLRSERLGKLADKSLGTLVKSLFESYLVPDGFEKDLLPEGKTPADRISLAISFRVSMEQGRWEETKKAIEELVSLRNDLVHHLIERFDVWTEEGCATAIAHLEASYQRIDLHYCELVEWAKSMDSAREDMVALSQTAVFHDLLLNGIAPDGSFDWPTTGIVRVLREAASRFQVEGWTSLEQARSWMSEAHPEQTPQKYQCRTWPQVLNESRQFRLEYRLGNDGAKQAWYRTVS